MSDILDALLNIGEGISLLCLSIALFRMSRVLRNLSGH